MTLRIAIGSDHHGVAVRSKTAELLRNAGHTVDEFGPLPDNKQPVDYPDIAAAVAEEVHCGKVDRGILICGTGIGMCITANKFSGVRAAPVIDELSAELSRRHNDLNVLCISGDMLTEEMIYRIICVFLETSFDGGRHIRRLAKIEKIEEQLGMASPNG
ncbi:MAG: ribose 5-phosphate isomerase B [Planctomycetaceae bacterium]|jgi:ribose 5-phosphate isomerase B|nr:ribose 5-phosphate isomerase B [Planctomycetaceae bacterium]